MARCVQTSYAISCICPALHEGNGIGPNGCIRSNSTYNACASNPCMNGGTCMLFGTFGYRCVCPPHTSLPRCARLLSYVCVPNPCEFGGTCVQMRTFGMLSYRCICASGRTGRNCQTEMRSCGGVLNSFNGTLKYPLSDTYPHNARCAWLIRTDENKVLNITFTKFNVEASRECRFDWLQVKYFIFISIILLSYF